MSMQFQSHFFVLSFEQSVYMQFHDKSYLKRKQLVNSAEVEFAKSNNRLLVEGLFYAFYPTQVKFSRSDFFSPNGFDLGRVNCILYFSNNCDTNYKHFLSTSGWSMGYIQCIAQGKKLVFIYKYGFNSY